MIQHFDKAYCIHYPDEERRRIIEGEFKRVGFDPTYVHAKRPMRGFSMSNMRRAPKFEFACNLSHIKAVGMSLGDTRPVFFEDDVRFSASWQEDLNSVMAVIPDNWDVLYLGGHPREKVEHIDGSLFRVKTFSCAEGYAFNNGAQKRFLSYWCDEIGGKDAMYDFILGRFAAKNNAYAIYPTITMQRTCHSHIASCVQEKEGLILRGWAANIED